MTAAAGAPLRTNFSTLSGVRLPEDIVSAAIFRSAADAAVALARWH